MEIHDLLILKTILEYDSITFKRLNRICKRKESTITDKLPCTERNLRSVISRLIKTELITVDHLHKRPPELEISITEKGVKYLVEISTNR